MNRLLCCFVLNMAAIIASVGSTSPPILTATWGPFLRDVISSPLVGRSLQSNAGNDFETVCEYVGGTPTDEGPCKFCDPSGCCKIDLSTFTGMCSVCSSGDEDGDIACTDFDCDIDVNAGGNITCAGCNEYIQSNATSGEEVCLQFTCDETECTCQGAYWRGRDCQQCEAMNDTFVFDCANVDGPDTVTNSSLVARKLEVTTVAATVALLTLAWWRV